MHIRLPSDLSWWLCRVCCRFLRLIDGVWYVTGHLNRYPAAYHGLTSVRLEKNLQITVLLPTPPSHKAQRQIPPQPHNYCLEKASQVLNPKLLLHPPCHNYHWQLPKKPIIHWPKEASIELNPNKTHHLQHQNQSQVGWVVYVNLFPCLWRAIKINLCKNLEKIPHLGGWFEKKKFPISIWEYLKSWGGLNFSKMSEL